MKFLPSKIRLDAATVCQLKCPECLTTKGEIAKNLGAKMLKLDNFKKLLDLNPWIRSIELSNWGEIFLNPDLLEIIKYAFEKKIALTALNGVNLNTVREEILEGLVKYQFSDMTCSIDGACNQTYQIYRKHGNFDQVMTNIRKINQFKTQYRSLFPRLRWQFIVFEHNEHEIHAARKMARELGMEFYLKLPWHEPAALKNKELIKILSGRNVTTRKEYQEKYGKLYLVESMCSQLWLQPQVNSDGKVLGCCVNYWGDYGNAFKQDFLEILNSEKMNYARGMLLGKKQEREDVPCTTCHWYMEMKKTQTWLFSRGKNSGAVV